MGIIAQAAAVLKWSQQQSLLPGGHYNVYRDDRDGVIDYNTPVNPAPIDAWPDREGKRGWGQGRWGRGLWGVGEAGLGWGAGGWGMGGWGFGGVSIQFTTPELPDGTYKLAAVGFDAAGNSVTPATAEATATLAGTPQKPGAVTATAYVQATDTLTLTFGLSADDEG